MVRLSDPCFLFCLFFGPVHAPHSGDESRFVAFLVAFCKRQGPYQSAVTQSACCLGAGLVLTMLMAGSLLYCEALWVLFLEGRMDIICPVLSHSCRFFRSTESLCDVNHNFTTLKAWGQCGGSGKKFDGRAVKEIMREAWKGFSWL